MKQVILRYGLISGAVAAVLMLATMLYYKYYDPNMDFENGHLYGYASMLLSMLFVFLGVRYYREQVAGGVLSFGKGFQVGLLIAVVSCVCYVLAWMVIYETLMPDFMEKYIEHTLANLRSSGAAEAEIARQTAEMNDFKEMYKNPLVRFGLTFLEPFPVGLLVSLVSAWVLRKNA